MNITAPKAPPLRVPYWIDGDGQELDNFSLSDMGDGYKVIFCFKASCPSCHSRGFPAMKKLVDHLSGKGFGFAAVHTAFDDDPFNSQARVRENQIKFGLEIPFGHDPKLGANYPTVMQDYRTRGTPFFLVIDPQGFLVFADFSLDVDKLIKAFEDK